MPCVCMYCQMVLDSIKGYTVPYFTDKSKQYVTDHGRCPYLYILPSREAVLFRGPRSNRPVHAHAYVTIMCSGVAMQFIEYTRTCTCISYQGIYQQHVSQGQYLDQNDGIATVALPVLQTVRVSAGIPVRRWGGACSRGDRWGGFRGSGLKALMNKKLYMWLSHEFTLPIEECLRSLTVLATMGNNIIVLSSLAGSSKVLIITMLSFPLFTHPHQHFEGTVVRFVENACTNNAFFAVSGLMEPTL